MSTIKLLFIVQQPSTRTSDRLIATEIRHRRIDAIRYRHLILTDRERCLRLSSFSWSHRNLLSKFATNRKLTILRIFVDTRFRS